MKTTNKNLLGVGSLVLGILIFSLQDIAVKGMGGNYPILEIVIFRGLVAMPITLLFFRLEGQRGLPTTKQHKLEYVRGLFLFLSYTTYFMGLAALPLAGTMVVAILTAQRAAIGGLGDLFGLLEFAYLVILAWLIVAGGGRWSVDQWILSRRSPRNSSAQPSPRGA